MHSIPPARSISQVRERATVGARGKWSAQKVMRALRAAHTSSPATQHVLTWLLLLANGKPSVTVKIDKLAQDTGQTRESVRYHLRQLRRRQDISIASDGKGGRGHANEWRLDVLDRLTDGGDAA